MSAPTPEALKYLMNLVKRVQGELAQERTVGARQLTVDLATVSTTAPYPYNARGYGLVMPAFDQPAGSALTVMVDGVPFPFQPGAMLMSPFQRVEVFNTANGANSGVAKLYIITDPDVVLAFGELGGGNLQAAAYTAAYNSTANIPSLVTDGISLANGKGARAVVSAPVGNTITAATGVWWLYDDLTGLWAESAIQADLSRVTARRAVAVPDEFVTVGRGRAFLEVRSGTHSGGAGSFTVSLYGN